MTDRPLFLVRDTPTGAIELRSAGITWDFISTMPVVEAEILQSQLAQAIARARAVDREAMVMGEALSLMARTPQEMTEGEELYKRGLTGDVPLAGFERDAYRVRWGLFA